MYLTNFSGWIDGLYWIFIDKTPCFISHMFYKYILVCRQFQDHLCFNREWFLWKYLIFNTTAGSHSQRPPKMLWSYLGQTNFCEHSTIILLFWNIEKENWIKYSRSRDRLYFHSSHILQTNKNKVNVSIIALDSVSFTEWSQNNLILIILYCDLSFFHFKNDIPKTDVFQSTMVQ